MSWKCVFFYLFNFSLCFIHRGDICPRLSIIISLKFLSLVQTKIIRCKETSLSMSFRSNFRLSWMQKVDGGGGTKHRNLLTDCIVDCHWFLFSQISVTLSLSLSACCIIMTTAGTDSSWVAAGSPHPQCGFPAAPTGSSFPETKPRTVWGLSRSSKMVNKAKTCFPPIANNIHTPIAALRLIHIWGGGGGGCVKITNGVNINNLLIKK